MPDGWCHQAITWTYVDLSSKIFCVIHLRSILQGMSMNLIHNMCSGTTLSKLQPHNPVAYELKQTLYQLVSARKT